MSIEQIREKGQKEYRAEYKQLYDDQSSWRKHWVEIANYMIPRRGRFLTSTDEKANEGKRKDEKIINGIAKKAINTLASGMQGGLTSPSRPWFELTLLDDALMEYAPVKRWLHDVRNTMLEIFSRSNVYASLHILYKELAPFGIGSMIIEEDFKSIVRTRPFTIGEFMIALDSNLRAHKLYRQYSMTANQMVEMFGEKNVSQAVKTAFSNNQGLTNFKVIHTIRPTDKIPGKKYESVYFEENKDIKEFLRISGYDDIPFVAPRWEVTSCDTYGEGPGMDALGDVKMLQKMEDKKLRALDKLVDPPMNAPSALKAKGGTIIAGGVNYYDSNQPTQKFEPAYQVNPDVQNIGIEIREVENRIKEFFYTNLFLSIIATDKRMTATEVAQRHEEKLIMLGPVLERLQSELLDPLIDRAFNIINKFRQFPPVPKEIQGMNLKVKYVSMLAQAQKLVGISSIERTAGFVSTIFNISPEVVDKFDIDEAVNQYGEMTGVPPKIIRSGAEVAEIRQRRQQQIAAQQMQEGATQAAQNAKTMSETRIGKEDNVLDALSASERE